MTPKLKIATQKKGRLSEGSLKLLSDCGIRISSGPSKLRASASGFPIEVLFLRDDDIPQYVQDGVADLGILGENEVLEQGKNVSVIERLGFSKCRLSLAIPKEFEYLGAQWFQGRKVATSYPNITQEYLIKKGVNADIEYIGGSVEVAPSIGLAEGICDLVSSGSTLITNGLKEVEVILKSEAVMIKNQNLSEEQEALIEKLLFRIQAVRRAKNTKYILLNAPDDRVDAITQILPGIKAPTVMPLAEKGWSSMHSVVDEADFWDIIDELKAAGAQGILVCPIEKMIV